MLECWSDGVMKKTKFQYSITPILHCSIAD
jgi:hypothetical protein